MERINTINARPDVNGAGKKGFHDNADISGQDATYISPEWCNHVQEEIANIIEGFGEALNPAQKNQVYMVVKGINDRTTAIENFIENIVDYFYPVGVIIDFGIPDFNPNVKYVGTTWVRHGEGKASVGLSDQESDPLWTKSVGSTFGSFTHQLSIAQLPSHYFVFANQWAGTTPPDVEEILNHDDIGWAKDGSADTAFRQRTESLGSNEAHNNVQPSIIDARWRRTA
ncbi:hypothetical protein F909_02888 [Acinetobacter sp. ANC 3929]|uniref:phage baseplate protein n=1 Tax=Acinetobacter sp. ANC 3929 TaxID=1217707 RepID=UPI0002CF0704|nr:hypothetical protein [Acinetobacter sp. ANC 3929]ENW79785.1 hypothetical protein F909_02888 [Acinetobacter sp. ANC 3929]